MAMQDDLPSRYERSLFVKRLEVARTEQGHSFIRSNFSAFRWAGQMALARRITSGCLHRRGDEHQPFLRDHGWVRLYLSSFRIGGSPERLKEMAGEGREAIVIANACDAYADVRDEAVERELTALGELGFRSRELDLRDYFGRNDVGRELAGADLVWVRGGERVRAAKSNGIERGTACSSTHWHPTRSFTGVTRQASVSLDGTSQCSTRSMIVLTSNGLTVSPLATTAWE